MVHRDGVDFTLLEPVWLSIVLFTALPVAAVAVFAALTERWLDHDSWFLTAPRAKVAPLLVLWLPAGPALVILLPIFLIALAVAALRPPGPVAPARAEVTWTVRTLLVGIAVIGAGTLVADTAALVG